MLETQSGSESSAVGERSKSRVCGDRMLGLRVQIPRPEESYRLWCVTECD
jgi:hypothetical protein